ncbi:MAG: DUF6541 family protein [Candidatus Woesearchaeota archaeon]
MEREELFTIIAIIAIVCIGFFARYAPYEGKIVHDYPVTINAGDPNSRLSEAEYVLESGSVKFMPPWFTGEKDLLTTQPPLNLILAAMVAGASGLKVFDVFYLNAVLASIGSALCFFVLFSRVFQNRILGLLAAGLLVFPLEKFFHYQINIGMYATFSTTLYFPMILLFTYELIKKPSWPNALLLVFALVSQFNMHASEAIVSGAVVSSYLVFFELKNVGWKRLVVAGALAVLMCLPYLPPLFFNYLQGHQGATFIQKGELSPPSHEPQIFLTNVLSPVLWVLVLIALIVTWKNKEYRLLNYAFFAYVLIIFILAKFGIGTYYVAIRGRPIFFIVAYPLVAIGLYSVANVVRRFVPVSKQVFFGCMIALVIAGQAYAASNVQGLGGSLYTEDIYKGFLWIRQNTPENATLLCFGCNQLESTSSHRVSAQAAFWEQDGAEQLLQIANKNNTPLRIQIVGYTDERIYRKGFLNYRKRGALGDHTRDICTFDYFAFRPSTQESLAVFNQILQNLLAKNASVVYNTPQMVILKNAHQGGCI